MSDAIRINTNNLREYAARIDRVNSRLMKIDARLKRLYYNVPVSELWTLIKVDAITGYSWNLRQCSNYLRETAGDFEAVERELSRQNDILNYQGIDSTKVIGTNKEDVKGKYEKIAMGYLNVVTYYGKDKIKKFADKVEESKNWEDIVVNWYQWFKKDLYGDLDNLRSIAEDVYKEYTSKEIKLLPKGVTDFFGTLSSCQVMVDVASELKKYYETGDGWEAYEKIGLSIFKSALKETNKALDKVRGTEYSGVAKGAQKALLSAIVKMPEKYIQGIKDYANGKGTAGSIVVETVIGSVTEAVADEAAPVYKAATALSYPVVDQICESVGYDLSAEYEKLTGKKGLEAVFSAQKELWVDVVYNGAKEKAAQGVDNFYSAVSKGWNHWKSGIKIMF